MTKRKRISRAVGMEAVEVKADPEAVDELERMIIQGLKLKLGNVRRKNPYFKRSRSEHERSVEMSRKEKLSAMSFARRVVKAYFQTARELSWIVSPN